MSGSSKAFTRKRCLQKLGSPSMGSLRRKRRTLKPLARPVRTAFMAFLIMSAVLLACAPFVREANPLSMVLFGVPYCALLAFAVIGVSLALDRLRSNAHIWLFLTWPLLLAMLLGSLWVTTVFTPEYTSGALGIIAPLFLVVAGCFLVAFAAISICGWRSFIWGTSCPSHSTDTRRSSS